MSFDQKIVKPSSIENELKGIWKKLAEEKKMRASIFNLIVFTKLSTRTDYFRKIVESVVEKFPCRILFITEDPKAKNSYLKTAISVLFPKDDTEVACDLIDIGASGKEIEVVPYVILPHLLTDLPIYLLWGEDPSHDHPLFLPLLKLSTRVIFDSEATSDLAAFSSKLLSLKQEMGFDIADLNWARLEGWKDLIASTFDTKERLDHLKALEKLQVSFNKRETEFFSHLNIQAYYLFAWLANCLSWNAEKGSKKEEFLLKKETGQITCVINTESCKNISPGAIISSCFETEKKNLFKMRREEAFPQNIKVEVSSEEKCELPYYYILGQHLVGHSIIKEISLKGTSTHFLKTLEKLQEFHEKGLL